MACGHNAVPSTIELTRVLGTDHNCNKTYDKTKAKIIADYNTHPANAALISILL